MDLVTNITETIDITDINRAGDDSTKITITTSTRTGRARVLVVVWVRVSRISTMVSKDLVAQGNAIVESRIGEVVVMVAIRIRDALRCMADRVQIISVRNMEAGRRVIGVRRALAREIRAVKEDQTIVMDRPILSSRKVSMVLRAGKSAVHKVDMVHKEGMALRVRVLKAGARARSREVTVHRECSMVSIQASVLKAIKVRAFMVRRRMSMPAARWEVMDTAVVRKVTMAAVRATGVRKAVVHKDSRVDRKDGARKVTRVSAVRKDGARRAIIRREDHNHGARWAVA